MPPRRIGSLGHRGEKETFITFLYTLFSYWFLKLVNLLHIQKQKLNKKQAQVILMKQRFGNHQTICCPPRLESFETISSSFIMLPLGTLLMHSFWKKIIMPCSLLLNPQLLSPQEGLWFSGGAPVLVILYLPGLTQPGRKAVCGRARRGQGVTSSSDSRWAWAYEPWPWCQFSILPFCVSTFSFRKLE